MSRLHTIPRRTPVGPLKAKDGGFTIVELMIATIVFSMILLLITVGVIRFTQAYYGGVVQSNTQNVARTILENVSQAIQFDGGAVSLPTQPHGSNEYFFCVGDDWYSYLPGWQLVSGTASSALHQTNHSFVVNVPGDTGNPGDGCSGAGPQSFSGTVYGTELLADDMRLVNLTITQVGTGNVYRIDVRVVYGDDALLYSPSGNTLGPAAPDATCQPGVSGSDFCAAADLSTVVEQRVSN